jgi:deoxycytidine triphosphate deaminase
MAQPSAVLSDGTIRRLVAEGRIAIEPWDPAAVQPASVDVRLGHSFRVFHNHRARAIDLRDPPRNLTEQVTVGDDEPFVVHPGEFVLARTLEWVRLPDDVVSRIEGKALALDTEVPTTDGWKTMAHVRVGDRVFDAEGNPTEVVATSEVLVDRECRELEFSDGTRVVADLSHQWEVKTKADRSQRGGPRLVTTEQIEQTLKVGREYNHHVAPAGRVTYEPAELPIHPYVLGAWLGDGTSTKAEITCVDGPILIALEAAGCAVMATTRPDHYWLGGEGKTRAATTGRYRSNGSLHSRLRALDLLANKHITAAYMTAGVQQRQELLEGLMDTDGYVDKWGRCELTSTRLALAIQARELVASLGFKPVIATKPAMLNGHQHGYKHGVTFTPERPVFRLPRKLDRQKVTGRFKRSRSIVAVRRVPSVPVRCLQVASPRGLFLVTRSFVPTHNSSIGRLGLIVHATAGFVDPGFEGTLTLEVTNLTRIPIELWPGLPIAQLSFMSLDAPAERPYGHPELGSHYRGQLEATESRYEGVPRPGA